MPRSCLAQVSNNFTQGLNGISGEKGAAGKPGDKGQKGDTGHPGVDVFQTVKVSTRALLPLSFLSLFLSNFATANANQNCKTFFLNQTNNNNNALSAFSAFSQGLKRSVTTLHGGTLGYAEIVAVKVFHSSHKYVAT